MENRPRAATTDCILSELDKHFPDTDSVNVVGSEEVGRPLTMRQDR